MASTPRDIAADLRARLEAHYARILDLCFDPGTGGPRDQEAVEQILRICDSLFRLDRKTLLSLKLFPDPTDTLHPPREGPPSMRDEGEALVIMRGVADAAGQGFLVADLRGRVFYANRVLTGLLGLDRPEDLEGKSLRSFYADSSRHRFEHDVIPAITEKGRWVGELDMRSAQGEDVATLQRLFLIHGAGGREPAIGGMVIDQRLQRRNREALRDSEANFRALAETANDGILVATGAGTHAYVNPRMVEMTGYSAKELTTTVGLRELADPEELERLLHIFRRRMQANEGPRCYPTRLRRKDGSTIHVEVTGSRTVWQGRPADTVIVRDVSRRKEIDQALRESEARYSLLVESSRDGVAIVQDGAIAFASRPGAAMFGYTPEELVGRPFLDLVAEEDRARIADAYRGRLAGEPIMDPIASGLRHRDGTVRRYEGHSAIIQYRGRPAMLIVVRYPFDSPAAEQAPGKESR